MSDRDAIAVVALLAGARWQAEPAYVDAFLDRGKRGKEPRLHLMQVDEGTVPYAFADTIEKPGSTTWAGFRGRTSTLVLAGTLSMYGYLPFQRTDGYFIPTVQQRDIEAWAKSHLIDTARAWGRECQGCVGRNGWWYTQDGAFYLPRKVATLPRVRDVLADPPKAHTWDATLLRAALRDVKPELRDNARLTVAYAHDTHDHSPAHQRLSTLDSMRTGIATALQYTLNLRSFGGGTSMPAPGSFIAPTPVWIGDIDLPSP
jgi:hypothetical protein